MFLLKCLLGHIIRQYFFVAYQYNSDLQITILTCISEQDFYHDFAEASA